MGEFTRIHGEGRHPDLGQIPSYLDDNVANAWRDIIQAAPPRSLRMTDRPALEHASYMLARFRNGEQFNKTSQRELNAYLSAFRIPKSIRQKWIPPS